MINLTCQRTHILAWLNVDNTLSLKLNGVKYVAYPKLDKRGERYWKVDGLVKDNLPSQASLPKKTLTLLESYQEKMKAGKPMSDFSKAEIDAYCQWEEQQKVQEQISQSQKVAEQLAQKIAKNHETSPQ